MSGQVPCYLGMKTTQSKTAPKFAILRFHQPLNGRSYYQSRDVGSVTCLVKNMWTTSDRVAAICLAGEVGGTVVTL